MKNLHLCFVLSLLILIVSCGESSKKQNESVEPNDEIDEANSIETGDEFEMKVHPKEDKDWYQVEVPGQGYLKLGAKNVPDDLNAQVRFASYDEWGDKKEAFLTKFLKFPATVAVPEKDTLYAMVADRWNENASETPFTLKFEFIEEFDEHEPNNGPELAKEIEAGKTFKSAIFPKGEEDWFKIKISEPGYIKLGAKDVPEDLNLAVYFATYDEFDDEKSKTIKGKGEVPQSVAITEPGEYYLVLGDRWNDNASEGLFTWKPEFIPEMDEFEPNNKYVDANEVQLNDIVQIAIYPKKDKDFFRINAEETGTLTLKASKQDEVNVAGGIYVLNDDDNELEAVKDMDELPVKFDIEETGKDYYIKIQDRWNDNASTELFDVIFDFESAEVS
ncbi:MAG: hypothetical protein ACQES1_08880 [Bacteroidota bacterium]